MFGTPSITGIDIGATEIKLVELTGKHKKQIKHLAVINLPSGLFEEGLIKDEAALLVQLKNLFKHHRISSRGRRVALALGGSAVIIRMVFLPNRGEVELADLIELEAEQHFQHDLNDLYYTWQILGDPLATPEVPVVLVGAKKTVVDQYISVLKKLGCKVRIIDCDVFAQMNMVEFNYGRMAGLAVLVNIAAAATQITFVGDGRYLYSREIAFGSYNYLATIAESMAISAEQAGSLLIASRENPAAVSGNLLTALNLSNEQLATEIQLTIDFFFQTIQVPQPLLRVDHLLLIGSTAYTFGLLPTLSERVVANTAIVNPLAKISVPDKFTSTDMVKFVGQYGTVIGLALREDELT